MATIAGIIDPFGGSRSSATWMLWLIPTVLLALACWYLIATRHGAYDETSYRRYIAGAIITGVLAFAAFAKFVHEFDQALSPIGVGGFLVLVVAAWFYLANPGPTHRR